MKRFLFLTALAGLLASCSGGDGGHAAAAPDTLTRAQKDSVVASLPVPGASAVGRAMEARDQANARTARHDAIR